MAKKKVSGLKKVTKKFEKQIKKVEETDPILEFGEFAPLIGGFAQFDVSIDYDAEDVEENVEPIIQEYRDMMPKAAVALKKRLDMALMAPIWDWSTGGSRDIFDTGALMRSGSVVWDGKSLIINYSVPYADIVHNGGYIFPYGNKNARPIYLPGRPWISAVLDGGGPIPRWSLEDWLLANDGGLVG